MRACNITDMKISAQHRGISARLHLYANSHVRGNSVTFAISVSRSRLDAKKKIQAHAKKKTSKRRAIPLTRQLNYTLAVAYTGNMYTLTRH